MLLKAGATNILNYFWFKITRALALKVPHLRVNCFLYSHDAVVICFVIYHSQISVVSKLYQRRDPATIRGKHFSKAQYNVPVSCSDAPSPSIWKQTSNRSRIEFITQTKCCNLGVMLWLKTKLLIQMNYFVQTQSGVAHFGSFFSIIHLGQK